MFGRLTVYFTDRPARSFVLHPGRRYRLGRDPSCEIHVDDERVSRRHAAFAFQEERWHCYDADSKNGVRIDGRAVSSSGLAHGAWLDIGGLLAQFTRVSERERATQRSLVTKRRRHAEAARMRLARAPGVRELLDHVLDSVIELGDMQRAFLMLRDEYDDFELAAMRRFGRADLEAAAFSGSLAAVQEALASQYPVVVCDVAGATRFAARPSIVAGNIRALVCLPLQLEGALGGVVYADSRTPGKIFSELDLEILGSFAEHAALALAAVAVRTEIDGLARGVLETTVASAAQRAVLLATRAAVRESGDISAPLTLGELLRSVGRSEEKA